MTTARPAARLTVLSGPSGVGKDSVIELIRARSPWVWLSGLGDHPAAPRDYEIDGVHYYFVDRRRVRAAGRRRRAAGVGRVRRQPATAPRARRSRPGSTPGSRCCWRSTCRAPARSARAMPEAQLVFLAPPSWDELERRLIGRGTDDADDDPTTALEHAREELAAEPEFDVTVVNDFVEQAADELVGLLGSPTSAQARTRRIEVAFRVRNRRQPRRHHQPADRRAAREDHVEVRAGHLRGQARPPDQRLLQPARRGPARVRRPAGRDHAAGEAALDRAARDQRRPARPPSRTDQA